MGKEIERKFIFNGDINEFNITKADFIIQNYLATGNEQVRLRKKISAIGSESTSFYLTLKIGSGMSREEIETKISEETYNQVINSLNTKSLLKHRSSFKWNNLLFEIDSYEDFDFEILEVEFPDEESAINFIPPEWLQLGEEVTEDKSYKNQTLWELIQ